jgi:hypothetical protein
MTKPIWEQTSGGTLRWANKPKSAVGPNGPYSLLLVPGESNILRMRSNLKMKNVLIVIALILTSAISGLGQKAAAGKADPTKGVHDAFDRLVAGIKEVNVDKVMDSYEKSPRLLIFNNNGTATIGWENIKANVAASYAKVSNVTLEITGLRIEMLDPRAHT